MKKLPFKSSPLTTLGVELELQIIDPKTYDLISKAKGLLRIVQESPYRNMIKPEITQSMIELNSSVHHSSNALLNEFYDLQAFLIEQGRSLGVEFCGGGTHPFQKWALQKIFPTKRFKNLSHQYRYLSKRSTVFGEHVHIGCPSRNEALYLTHMLARYVPQFIAISASSPFYQGIDTGYNTCRTTIFNSFPLSGVVPYLSDWQAFSNYFYEMRKLGIIQTMKDFYWDIRPKPEFGTVEIRVCDTPLTIEKTVRIAAFIQTLSHYILLEKPHTLCNDLYYLYPYNRFQASRYGLDATIIDPFTLKHCPLQDDILNTLMIIRPHAKTLKTADWLQRIANDVKLKKNDAERTKHLFQESHSLTKVVREHCKIWVNRDTL